MQVDQTQTYTISTGHRHSLSMPSHTQTVHPHMPSQPSNLSVQTSLSHDDAGLDDSGIGMSLVDEDALSKFSFTTTDMGHHLIGAEMSVNIV